MAEHVCNLSARRQRPLGSGRSGMAWRQAETSIGEAEMFISVYQPPEEQLASGGTLSRLKSQLRRHRQHQQRR